MAGNCQQILRRCGLRHWAIPGRCRSGRISLTGWRIALHCKNGAAVVRSNPASSTNCQVHPAASHVELADGMTDCCGVYMSSWYPEIFEPLHRASCNLPAGSTRAAKALACPGSKLKSAGSSWCTLLIHDDACLETEVHRVAWAVVCEGVPSTLGLPLIQGHLGARPTTPCSHKCSVPDQNAASGPSAGAQGSYLCSSQADARPVIPEPTIATCLP